MLDSLIQKLGLVERKLADLATDDPSVIETSLEEYGDLVHPDKMSVLHRFIHLLLIISWKLSSESCLKKQELCSSLGVKFIKQAN